MSVIQETPTAIESILQVFVPLSSSDSEVVVTKDSKHVNGFLVDPSNGNGTSIFAATNVDVAKILVPENVADLSVENTGSSDIDGTYKLLHQNKYAQIHTNHVVWVREGEEEEKLAVYFVYDTDLGFQDAGETGRWVLGAWPQPTGSPIAVHYVQKEASTNRFPFVDQWVLPNEVITKPPQTETQLNDDYSEAKLLALQEYNRRVELSELDPDNEDYEPFDSSKVNDPQDLENYIENYDPGYDPTTPEEESVTVPETRVTSLDVELDDGVESLDILKMQLKRGGDVTNVLNDTHETQTNINLNVDDIGKHMAVIAGQKVDVRLTTSTSTSGVTDLGELHLACLDVNTVSTLESHVRLTGVEGFGFSAWNGLSSNKTPEDFTDWVYDDSSIHVSISLPNAQSTRIHLLPYIHQNFDNQQVIMDRVAQPSYNIFEMISHDAIYDEAYDTDSNNPKKLPRTCLGRVSLKHRSANLTLCINRDRVSFLADSDPQTSDPSYSPELLYRNNVTFKWVGAGNPTSVASYQVRNIKKANEGATQVTFELHSGDNLTIKVRPVPALGLNDQITLADLVLKHDNAISDAEGNSLPVKFVLDGMQPDMQSIPDDTEIPDGTDLHLRQKIDKLSLNGTASKSHFEIVGVLLKQVEISNSLSSPVVIIEDCVVDSRGLANPLKVHDADLKFRSGPTKTTGDLLTSRQDYEIARQDPGRCQTINLNLELNQTVGKVEFDGVLMRCVPSNPTTRFLLSNASTGQYALRASSTISLAGDTLVISFVNRQSYLGIEAANCNGVLLDTQARKIKLQSLTSDPDNVPSSNMHRRSYLQTVRAFDASSISQFSNVGVIFRGTDVTDVPMDISDVSLCNNVDDSTQTNANDSGLAYVAFGTSAMSVDQTNVSNLASIVATLAGQGLKWISHQGHHIVGWKMDEPRVLYRKTHAQSHRKLVYTDSEGQAALPGQRMEHAFILGMIPGVTDDFTGETGGLFGLDLELLAHEALQQTFGGDTNILNTKLNELENILFGSADGAGFRVGIAGYLHSDHGGFENLRIFNGQPCGKYTIMFETDEGFRVKDPADVIRTLHYWLGLATMQARFQEPSTATVKLFRGKGDFSPWAISPMRYQLVERDTVSVGVWEQTDTGFASILHNDQTNSISVKGTTKTLSVHLLDHAMLWDSGIYLTRPTDDDLKNQYLSNLNVTVDSATAVSFSAVTHPSGIFVQFKPPESGTQYDFTQYRGSFDISHTLNGSDKTGWPQNETTQVGLQFPQYFKDDDNFTHATYEAPVPQNASGYPLASESVLPLPNDTDTFLVSLTADVAVDASVVNVILVDSNNNSITNIKTNNPTFYGEVKDGQKNAANFTNVELMTPASSNPADYKSDTVEGNAVVTSETFTLGITMFSKPGNTLNPDVIHGDSIWKPDVPNKDYQYLVIVPRATESRVYDPNNLSQNVNTFHATDTTSWTVALNDTIGRPEDEYDTGISIINEADIKWHTAQTDRPDGKYSVIKVPAKMFASLLSDATSRIILIDITANTTDSAAHLRESIMGAPMRASFSIIPLVADDSTTPNPTSANNYALYASVPVKFRMYFENAQASTSGRPLKLTGRVLDSQSDDNFDMSLFTNNQSPPPKLVVDFVARPASSTPNAQVDINFRTVHNTQSEPQDQFTIRQVESSIDEHFDTVDHSPLIFTQVQFRTFEQDYGKYQMTITAQVNQDAENKRKLTLEFPWLANTSSPNSQRIFYVGVDSFKYGDDTANVASSINGEARRLWTLKPANHEAERMFQFALNTNLNLPNNGEVLWDAPEFETSGSGNGPAVSSNLTIDMQIRLQSASLSDGTSIVRAEDLSLENQMRDYQYTYVWSNDSQQPAPTEIYINPSITFGNGILNRPLKSILERVWIGWSFFDTSLVDSAGALGNFAVELDAEVKIDESVQSVKPEFYKSHSGDESFSSAVYNAAPVTTSPPHNFSYNTYRGAWIDFSNLQTLLSSQTGVLICDIYAIMRPPNEAEQQQGALTNQIQGKFGVGLKVLIAKVDLSNAGRVELLNMDNVSMSSVRIGNWVMRPDSSGHLRFNHEVFDDTGEASTEQNANIEFTMSAASVANIQTANETDVVDVVGTSFRLTGHPNE